MAVTILTVGQDGRSWQVNVHFRVAGHKAKYFSLAGARFFEAPKISCGGKTGIQIPITNLGREHNLSIIEK